MNRVIPVCRVFFVLQLAEVSVLLSVSSAFVLQGQKVLVEGSDTFTLTSISRESAGDYKCSLTDNEKLEASQTIAVVCECHIPPWHILL